MGRYLKNLKEAVEEFQPAVEGLFNVSLGNIEYNPVSLNEMVKTEFPSGALFFLAWVKGWEPFAKNNTSVIHYNKNFLLNLLPKSTAKYIAAHEMSHLAHRNSVFFLDFLAIDDYFVEAIADYAAHKALNLIDNFKPIIALGYRPAEHAAFIKTRLKKTGVDFKEYIKNLREYEPSAYVGEN